MATSIFTSICTFDAEMKLPVLAVLLSLGQNPKVFRHSGVRLKNGVTGTDVQNGVETNCSTVARSVCKKYPHEKVAERIKIRIFFNTYPLIVC